MESRKEQKEKRRAQILNAALDLFISKGYSSTKISDIAQHVGMSTGLMFHYFESKEKLYEELIKMGTAGPMSIFEQSYTEPLSFFENSAKLIFEAIKNEPFMAKMFVLMNQAFYNEAASQAIKDMINSFDIYKPTVAIIEQGQKNMTIREGDCLALAIAYWCAIQGIAEQLAQNPDLPCPSSDWIIDIIRRKSE